MAKYADLRSDTGCHLLFVSAGCAPRLQPAVQGEWSNVHNDKDKISENARPARRKVISHGSSPSRTATARERYHDSSTLYAPSRSRFGRTKNIASNSSNRRLRCPITRHGIPATTANSATFLFTKLSAPTEAPSSIVTPGMITLPQPIKACFLNTTSPICSLRNSCGTVGLLINPST